MSEIPGLITEDMLTPEQQQAMAEYHPLARPAARALLQPHVEAVERMEYLDFEPDKPESWEDFQEPDRYLVTTPRMPIKEGTRWATLADSRFPGMIEMAGEGQEAQEIIHEAGEIIANGGFIWIVTPHIDDLTDIAYAGHITTTHLADQDKNYQPEDTLVVVSVGVSEGSYKMELETPEGRREVEVPMLGAARTGFTKIVRTWPKTESALKVIEGFKLPKFAVDSWMNGNAVRVIEHTVAEGHATGSMGSSGTTRTKDGAMAPINSKTAAMLSLPNAHVLGMTLWRQSDRPVARYMGRPVKLDPNHPEQVDDLFERLTSDMNEHVPGGNFRYTRPATR